ncbi:hypothetical protein IWQ60_008591 [Tieghemiomyces parasiticus]|uniref:AB hydrolase-1 domain-containing protein n=1 Tax=Tieghemiomyces parasiticus TaxID=78921 RepID=A0A9W7ZZH5_9FUNG|nr:hypothetical protein IWQ60_008591 [Tieghemiomyces parasiticus]
MSLSVSALSLLYEPIADPTRLIPLPVFQVLLVTTMYWLYKKYANPSHQLTLTHSSQDVEVQLAPAPTYDLKARSASEGDGDGGAIPASNPGPAVALPAALAAAVEGTSGIPIHHCHTRSGPHGDPIFSDSSDSSDQDDGAKRRSRRNPSAEGSPDGPTVAGSRWRRRWGSCPSAGTDPAWPDIPVNSGSSAATHGTSVEPLNSYQLSGAVRPSLPASCPSPPLPSDSTEATAVQSTRHRNDDDNDNGSSMFSLMELLQKECPSLTDPEQASFKPSMWLFNAHLQTATITKLAYFKGYDVNYKRESVALPDGGGIAIDWYPSFEENPDTSLPIVFMLHGLTGGSHEFYVRAQVKKMTEGPGVRQTRFRAVVMNNRGCGFSELLTPKMYSAGNTEDVRYVINHIHARYPTTPMVGVGFSLGANIIVKYAGEEGDRCVLRGLVSVGNPFNMLLASEKVSEGILGSLVYKRVMRNNMVHAFMRHKHVFLGSDLDVDQVAKSKTMSDFDDLVTCRVFGYESPRDYYIKSSSAPYVAQVRIPLLCLNSLDDPVCSSKSIPYQAFRQNPYAFLATTQHGGHLAWLEAGSDGNRVRPWSVNPVAEFCAATVRIGRTHANGDLPGPSTNTPMIGSTSPILTASSSPVPSQRPADHRHHYHPDDSTTQPLSSSPVPRTFATSVAESPPAIPRQQSSTASLHSQRKNRGHFPNVTRRLPRIGRRLRKRVHRSWPATLTHKPL